MSTNEIKLKGITKEVGITRLRNALTNHKHVIFSACVSYGKNGHNEFMAKGAVEKGNKVLIVSHRSELMTQTGERWKELALRLNISLQAQEHTQRSSSIQWLKLSVERLEKPEWVEWVKSVSLCLIDEGHTSDADFLLNPGVRLMISM